MQSRCIGCGSRFGGCCGSGSPVVESAVGFDIGGVVGVIRIRIDDGKRNGGTIGVMGGAEVGRHPAEIANRSGRIADVIDILDRLTACFVAEFYLEVEGHHTVATGGVTTHDRVGRIVGTLRVQNTINPTEAVANNLLIDTFGGQGGVSHRILHGFGAHRAGDCQLIGSVARNHGRGDSVLLSVFNGSGIGFGCL